MPGYKNEGTSGNKKSRAEAPQCCLKNKFFVGLLYLRYHMPKNFSAISVARL